MNRTVTDGDGSAYRPASNAGRIPVLTTDRLRLRGWHARDFDAYAALFADSRVTELAGTEPLWLSFADVTESWQRQGFGAWAVEHRRTGRFIGVISILLPGHQPAPEISWVLDPRQWGRGYATEAARAAISFAFDVLGLPSIVSACLPQNVRSARVIEKLGMRPVIVLGHHERDLGVTQYELSRDHWAELRS